MSEEGKFTYKNFHCYASLYHRGYVSRHVFYPTGFGLVARVHDVNTKQLIRIPQIALIMGVGNVYHPGWNLWEDERMNKKNIDSFNLEEWKFNSVDENTIGGDAYFVFPDGHRGDIRGLRISKSKTDYVFKLPPIVIDF